MSGSERRRYTRIPVNIPTGIYIKDNPYEVIDAEILSISDGGAFIHCTEVIEPGKEVLIEIRFAETKLFDAIITKETGDDSVPDPSAEQSIVRWTDNKSGFGVEFVALKPDKKKFLEKLLAYFNVREKPSSR